MSDSAAAKAYELWKAVEGSEESTGEWMEITQDRICLLYTSDAADE